MEAEAQGLHELLAIFAAAGFRVPYSGGYTFPPPFMKVNTVPGMDLQLNVFCYRY